MELPPAHRVRVLTKGGSVEIVEISAAEFDDLRRKVEQEELRRATMRTAEEEAAQLAVQYSRAGGMLDVLIEAMCNGLEEAAAQHN